MIDATAIRKPAFIAEPAIEHNDLWIVVLVFRPFEHISQSTRRVLLRDGQVRFEVDVRQVGSRLVADHFRRVVTDAVKVRRAPQLALLLRRKARQARLGKSLVPFTIAFNLSRRPQEAVRKLLSMNQSYPPLHN